MHFTNFNTFFKEQKIKLILSVIRESRSSIFVSNIVLFFMLKLFAGLPYTNYFTANINDP